MHACSVSVISTFIALANLPIVHQFKWASNQRTKVLHKMGFSLFVCFLFKLSKISINHQPHLLPSIMAATTTFQPVEISQDNVIITTEAADVPDNFIK